MTKETLEITLYTSELLYDIRTKLRALADTEYTDDTQERAALIRDETDYGQTHILLRHIGTAYSILRKQCEEYIVEDIQNADNILMQATRQKQDGIITYSYKGQEPDSDTTQTEDNTLTLFLRVPANFNHSVRDALSATMHTYIVDAALSAYLSLRGLSNAATLYAEQSESAITMVDQALSARIRPTRIRMPEETYSNPTNDQRYE